MGTCKECKECKWWKDCYESSPEIYKTGDWGECGLAEFQVSLGKKTMGGFGCIHWESKDDTHSANYPTRTAQDLEIADLKRENNAAFDRIKELSEELVRLGVDPTAKAD